MVCDLKGRGGRTANRLSFFKWLVLSPKNTWASHFIRIISHWIVETFAFSRPQRCSVSVPRTGQQTRLSRRVSCVLERVAAACCGVSRWAGRWLSRRHTTRTAFLMCTVFFFCKRAGYEGNRWAVYSCVLNLTLQVMVRTAAPSLLILLFIFDNSGGKKI